MERSPRKTMGPRQRDTPKYSSHPKEERKESSRTEAGELSWRTSGERQHLIRALKDTPRGPLAEGSTARAKALRHD